MAEIAFSALRAIYGGERVYVPKRNSENKARIQQEYAEGAKISELTRKYGVTAQTVRNYLKLV